MNNLPYIIEVQIAFVLLWGAYRLLMHRAGSLGHNRIFLLGMVGVAFLLPALSIPVWAAPEVFVLDVHTLPADRIAGQAQSPQAFDYGPLLRWIYMGGVAVLIALSAAQLVRLRRIIRSSTGKVRMEGCDLVETDRVHNAIAFYRYILVNRRRIGQQELPQVVAHEQAHIRLGHSYDLMFAQAVVIALWWNPAVWLWKRSLREIHEFQADECALAQGFNAQDYALLMIQNLAGIRPEFASGFSYSLIKKRILMISKNKRGSALRTLFALPVTVALMALFSFTQKPATLEEVKIKEIAAPAKAKAGAMQGKTPKLDTVKVQIKEIKAAPAETKAKTVQINAREIVVKDGGDPMIIVDGKKVASIDGFSPEAVEFVTVLKGSSATSAYGQEAKDGVVVITTKNADQGAANAKEVVVLGYGTQAKSLTDDPKVQIAINEVKAKARETKEVVVIGYGTRAKNPEEEKVKELQFSGSFIEVKSDGKEPVKIMAEGTTTVKYLVDGKEVSADEVKKMDDDNIESIAVKKSGGLSEVAIKSKAPNAPAK